LKIARKTFALIAALACLGFGYSVPLHAQDAGENDRDSHSFTSHKDNDDKDDDDRDNDRHKHKHKHKKECEDKDRDDKDRDRDRDKDRDRDDKDRDRDREEARDRDRDHDRDHDRDRDRDRDDDDDDCKVTPPPVLASCLPSSSLSVLIQGSNVSSYVPNGSWGQPVVGIHLVPLEGGVARASIATPGVVNSCSSNSVTGETVCTANSTDIYKLTGSTLGATLTSSGIGQMSFSGGPCTNCGVAIDAGTNQAVITLSVDAAGHGGFQFLNLATNTLAAPIAAGGNTSEDISIDPVRHLVLSPNEQGDYQILQTQPTPALFNQAVSGAPMLDAGAEDCTTGIALASDEETGNLFIADLTQAVFTAGSPAGTWTAPSQLQFFPEFLASFQFGTDGIAVAPGSHLAIVAGEFAGSTGFGVIQLPATSGTGTPAVLDWAAANMPNDPSGAPWAMGHDPHTVTAYISPNTGKAIGVIANESRSFIALVDLQALLSAARTVGTHNVSPAVILSPGIVTFVSIP
jgi:hypothetical protein